MKNMGRIIRVTGPLVVADDMRGSRMYEVVRVGELGLIGEIIRLEGDKAVIQVYEETAGVKPGEPVIGTGASLSVELGPGLLTSIYDGIQRPLEILREKSGDFIGRGLTAPALPRDKKWHFTPKVKVGDKVTGGDIIGVVPETSIIEHKIMVPPGIEGEIVEIVEEGEYTIEEVVAKVKTPSGEIKELKMYQKWPVRQKRPYKEKLPPEVPLITGQRIIDTFFPQAKGGTAAIPGPFGSGKCVDGDTLVLTKEFGLIKIKDLYEKLDGKGKKTVREGEEWTELDEPITLYGYKDGKIVEIKATHVYKGYSQGMIEIKTRTGRRIKVTPIHKLFTGRVTKDGLVIEEVMAMHLKKGDRILVAKKIDGGEDAKLNISVTVRSPKKVRIPEVLDERLAEFLGYLLADGTLKPRTVAIYNNDESLLKRANDLARELFGIEGKIVQDRTVKALLIHSKALVEFFKALGVPGIKKAGSWKVPKELLMSKPSVVDAFIKAYIACDGHYNEKKGKVEIATASEEAAYGLSYLLAKLGIYAITREKEVKGRKYYRVIISGKANLEKLGIKREGRGYTSIDVIPVDVEDLYEAIGRLYAELKGVGIEIHNYLSGENMSYETFKKFAKFIGMEEIAENHLSHVLFDEIVEIRYIDEPQEVYDVTTETHNFIGGNMPTFLHNTVTQHQLAKWSDAEVVVYIGCGERGNEMTDVLEEFPKLTDPNTGKPLMERTVLIANTSNMPVAAREASIYTGITIAEYFRDMGYNVALMADSTSRWAEALREISGRLEEMPGEEGYPAYLASKIAEFYERAGRVRTLGSDDRIGSVSVIGAVSPPGGDLSDPVVQNTLRVVKVFWALDADLARRRHFPAINWLTSYSLYVDSIKDWWHKNVDPEWKAMRDEAMKLLQKEAELEEIVRIVGPDALPERERAILLVARMIREDYLQQDAFHEVDTYCPPKKQITMMRVILNFYRHTMRAIDAGIPVEEIAKLPVREEIGRMKYNPNIEEIASLIEKTEEQFKELFKKYGE
ncbi:V-type ATP synthase subunit A [Thermococcus aggregans]|uniref:A-type ATP synthase subunit A n=2 Tax=Thermococcus aggregans TaxID=110163 RepID=A0A9E7MYK4_THEAG|nr:V-type ATP synthase subunit A [Thermococcus aggregans]USS41250.1 V-type ATP synthase subunit A [Thermococcus aggregans]